MLCPSSCIWSAYGWQGLLLKLRLCVPYGVSRSVFRDSALTLPQRQEEAVTVYMGVPTMYSYLLAKYDQASEQDQQQAR